MRLRIETYICGFLLYGFQVNLSLACIPKKEDFDIGKIWGCKRCMFVDTEGNFMGVKARAGG
jgi:hypothetical protein